YVEVFYVHGLASVCLGTEQTVRQSFGVALRPQFIDYRPSCNNAWIRSSVGGCVLKRPSNPCALKGLMMNRCAVAGFASSGTCFDAASILRNALTRPCGECARAAPPASASNSRVREIHA